MKVTKRGNKTGNDAPATPTPAANGESKQDLENLVSEKLAPMDEYRERSEAWMKEITSQVARLASGAEADTKRSGGIDERLADLENRIQSLLTITEMVSADKNPFAATKAEDPAPSAPAIGSPPAPEPKPANPAPVEPSTAPATAPGRPQVSEHPAVEGSLLDTAPAPMAAQADPFESTDDASSEDDAPDADTIATERAIHNAFSPANKRGYLPKRADKPRAAHHPNDEREDETPTTATPTAPTPEVPPTRDPSDMVETFGPDAGPADGHDTRRRLMILQWAELLSHELPKLDLGSFLGFYVETGWVDRALAACVRNLAWQLHHAESGEPVRPQHTLPELHARSILMLSHLSSTPVPREEAARFVQDAQQALGEAPILTQR